MKTEMRIGMVVQFVKGIQSLKSGWRNMTRAANYY